MSMGRKIIAVDFDGTLCINQDVVNWPYLGQPNKELVEKLKALQDEGHVLILWTCREGELLEQAVAWCRNFCGINFDAVNDNKVDYFQNLEYVLIHIISERTVKSTVLLNCRKMTDKMEKKL